MRALIILITLALISPALGQSKTARCQLGKFVDGCIKLDGSIFHGPPGPFAKDASSTGDSGVDLEKLGKAIENAARNDLTYSLALSRVANTAQSNARGDCYQEVLNTADKLSAIVVPSTDPVVKDDQGNVLTKPDPGIATNVEIVLERAEALQRKVEAIKDALKPTSTMMIKCQSGATATGMGVVQFIQGLISDAGMAAVLGPKLGL